MVIYDLSFLPQVGNGDLLSLKHAFDAFGIPYLVTQDLNLATKAPEMLVVAGRIDPISIPDKKFRRKLAKKLERWARKKGRTLWVSGVWDEYFLSRFGLAVESTSESRGFIYLNPRHPLTKYVDTSEEQEVWLASPQPGTFVRTRSYRSIDDRRWRKSSIATYPDGSDAILVLRYRKRGGRTIILGVKFNDLLTRLENQLNGKHTRGSTNLFEPSADTIRLLLRASYEEWTKHPQLRPFAPEGKKAAVLLTHDMDATSGFIPLRDLFLPKEESLGVRSTLFITTNYQSNGWIGPFYTNLAHQSILADALERGFPLESHSVSHLPDMYRWPIGDPIENPDNYSPQYDTSTGRTTGGMVLPEILISAKLLEDDFGVTVRGWRSGHLTRPRYLGSLLAASGYTFTSNMAAGRVGGSFPYLMLADYFFSGEEVPVLEFPLAISDSKISTRPPEDTTRIWLEVTQKNKANNAPTVILVHTTKPDLKFPPYSAYLDAITTDPDLWVGSISDYYQWYREQGIRSEIVVNSKGRFRDILRDSGKGGSPRGPRGHGRSGRKGKGHKGDHHDD